MNTWPSQQPSINDPVLAGQARAAACGGPAARADPRRLRAGGPRGSRPPRGARLPRADSRHQNRNGSVATRASPSTTAGRPLWRAAGTKRPRDPRQKPDDRDGTPACFFLERAGPVRLVQRPQPDRDQGKTARTPARRGSDEDHRGWIGRDPTRILGEEARRRPDRSRRRAAVDVLAARPKSTPPKRRLAGRAKSFFRLASKRREEVGGRKSGAQLVAEHQLRVRRPCPSQQVSGGDFAARRWSGFDEGSGGQCSFRAAS